jgi:hypothetical protein
MKKRTLAAAGSLLLSGSMLLVGAGSAEAAGQCRTSTTNGGHTAVGKCSGYSGTGTFRVHATPCTSHCGGDVAGNWAHLDGGTSRANMGSGYATRLWIEFGPNSG